MRSAKKATKRRSKTAISEEKQRGEKQTARLEAFSDGVFAIAITLLALEIHVPKPEDGGGHSLGAALLQQWPVYLAYGTSFLTILIMWINHHRLFEQITRKDHSLLLYNGLLLMVVTLIPFPTNLVAEYIRTPEARLAVCLYSGFSLAMAVCFNLLWRHASQHAHLLAEDHDRSRVQKITDAYKYGPLLYLVALGLAFVNVYACLGMNFLLAAFFALPEKRDTP